MVLYFLLIVILVVLIAVAFSGNKAVAWADKMRRVNDLFHGYPEWTAPDYVRQQVRADYLAAFERLSGGAPPTPIEAAHYLSGPMLSMLTHMQGRLHMAAPFYEAISADHYVTVRGFTVDGERCLLIDRQVNRKIAVARLPYGTPWLVQAIDDGIVVYRMAYDRTLRRWKIEEYLHHIPLGSAANDHLSLYYASLFSPYASKIGREN